MNRTILAMSVALLISVAFVSAGMAQSKPMPVPAAAAPAALEKFSGAIEKIDSAKKELVVKKGNDEKSFAWTDHTKFMKGDKETSFTDLKKGTEVTVAYKKEGANLTAERVDVGTTSS